MHKDELRKRLIEGYSSELLNAQFLKNNGQLVVDASMAGRRLANCRSEVPIDEYIAMWRDGISALEAGADPNEYNQ